MAFAAILLAAGGALALYDRYFDGEGSQVVEELAPAPDDLQDGQTMATGSEIGVYHDADLAEQPTCEGPDACASDERFWLPLMDDQQGMACRALLAQLAFFFVENSRVVDVVDGEVQVEWSARPFEPSTGSFDRELFREGDRDTAANQANRLYSGCSVSSEAEADTSNRLTGTVALAPGGSNWAETTSHRFRLTPGQRETTIEVEVEQTQGQFVVATYTFGSGFVRGDLAGVPGRLAP